MDDAELLALRLAREGFGGGDPEKIMTMRTDTVCSLREYVGFIADYEATVLELNKP